MADQRRYEKAYDLPYPEAVDYPYERMPMADRAAQFAAFKALSGYEEAVEETARLNNEEAGGDAPSGPAPTRSGWSRR